MELARRLYADPRGLTGAVELIAPDAEFDFSEVYPDMRVLRGAAAVRRFRDTGPWVGSPIHLEPERFFDVDDERVLVFVQMSATGTESGVQVELQAAHELTIREGRLVRFKSYGNREQALRAVGLD